MVGAASTQRLVAYSVIMLYGATDLIKHQTVLGTARRRSHKFTSHASFMGTTAEKENVDIYIYP